jgi:hypothetical protein
LLSLFAFSCSLAEKKNFDFNAIAQNMNNGVFGFFGRSVYNLRRN